MTVYSETFNIHTNERDLFHDITQKVQSIVTKSKIMNGLVTVTVLHTTCGLTLNEWDPNLFADLYDLLEKVIPKALRMGHYRHPAPKHVDRLLNAHSHLRSVIIGQSQTIPVNEGKVQLGTYQKFIFIELEGLLEKDRRIFVQIMGE